MRSWLSRISLALLFGLHVWSQAGALGHAAEHGFENHEHEGIVCQLDAVLIQHQAILPDPPVLVPPRPGLENSAHISAGPGEGRPPPARAPPPRGPPTLAV